MSNSEDSLRIPLMSASRLGIAVAMGLVWLLLGVGILTSPGSSDSLFRITLLIAGNLGIGGPIAYALVRFYGVQLILDADGIWLERFQSKRGLSWSDVAGYERSEKALIIYGKDGRPIKLPALPLLDYHENPQAMYRVLDRRIGPDRERVGPPRPNDPLLAKVQDYYGKVPPVEMEPGAVYRNAHRIQMRRTARQERMMGSALVVAGLAFLLLSRWIPYREWTTLALAASWIPLGLFFYLRSRLVERRAHDRFLMRDGALYRIRDGEEHLLPPPNPNSQSRFHGQPVTRFGRGPFAYEISMQFLEPDV